LSPVGLIAFFEYSKEGDIDIIKQTITKREKMKWIEGDFWS
jgi:hypothetical protein